jgi:azurin
MVLPLLTMEPAPTEAARHAAIRAAASINREHARTFAALAGLIERGEDIPAAAAALKSLPRSALNAARCADIAATLVAWAQAVPADERTTQDYLSAVQFVEGLVTMLPPPRAAEVLEDLRELRVAVFVVGSVREQMRYDTPRLVVEAGKPFEITFENVDLMPHNLAIVTPGSRKRVGEAAMKMKPDQPDRAGRVYVPDMPEILAATKLLENGQRETLKLTAPETEGDYEYVCTYPDHWQVMWGRLVVTKDIDAYLRANPDKGTPATKTSDAPAHQHGK